jgi:hypothetical protein
LIRSGTDSSDWLRNQSLRLLNATEGIGKGEGLANSRSTQELSTDLRNINDKENDRTMLFQTENVVEEM